MHHNVLSYIRKITLKKQSFTLMESMICLIVLSSIVFCMVSILKPADVKNDAYKHASLNTLIYINVATKQILANYSQNHSMLTLKNISGTSFNLSDSNKNAYLSALYAKYLQKRTQTASSAYTDISLTDTSGSAVGSLKVSSFSNGIFIKNKSYVAFKLNANCTTTETNTIYDPSTPDNHSKANSCGLIFFDSNGEEAPNVLGIDMNIVSIGKYGIK